MRLPRNVFRVLIILEAAVLLAVALFGFVRQKKEGRQAVQPAAQSGAENLQGGADREQFVAKKDGTGQDGEDSGDSTGGEDNGDGDGAERSGEPEGTGAVTFPEEVQAKLASMTLEEKVAQMFLITPEALTHSDVVEAAGESTRAAVSAYPVGGLLYSAGNFRDKEQTRGMLAGVQGFSQERIGLPMFLAVRELGGSENSPVAAANGYGQQRAPSEIGGGGAPEEAAQAAGAIAVYLSEEGFNLNLMPVAGLAGEGGREAWCYGSDVQSVSMMAAEAVTAVRAGGIRTAAGIFPGRQADGSTGGDWSEWEDTEGLVFRACMDAGTDCMILGNEACEGLTGSADTPCSLSGKAVSYLRNDMGYTGIIMTDNLSEEAVSARYSAGEAAVEAVKSGVDLLCCPADFEEAYRAVVDAVNRGEIPAEAIDRAAGNILVKKLV